MGRFCFEIKGKFDGMEILNLLLQILVFVVQLLILLIPFFGTKALFDMRYSGFKRATNRGRLLLGLIALAIICTIFQVITSEKLNQIKDEKLKKEIALNQYRTQELLAKYGLKVDNKNDEIVRILRDTTLKNTTINNHIIDPYLKIDNIEMTKTGDTLNFKIWYCSKESTSYDTDVLLDIVAYNSKKDSFSIVVRNLRDIATMIIPKDECLVNNTHSFIELTTKNDQYVFMLHGNYKNSLKKVIKVNYMYSYYLDKKLFGAVSVERLESLMKFLGKKRKYK